MADRLDGLGHHAVIGGHHKHHHVGHGRTARTHGREGLVARRVDEGHARAVRHRDLVGADMLRDAARFMRDHVGLAQRIEQRGLAVVDMAHDGHDRRARLQVGVGILRTFQAHFDVGFRHALHAMAEFLHDQLGRIRVDGLRQRRHHAHAEQRLHHLAATRGHAVRKFLHGDRFRHHHVAHDAFRAGAQALQLLLPALAVAGTAQRGDRTAALVLALDRGLHVDAAVAAAVGGRRGLLDRHRHGAAPGRARRATGAAQRRAAALIFILGSVARLQRQARGGRVIRLAGRRRGGRGPPGLLCRGGHGHRGGLGGLARFLLDRAAARGLGGLARLAFGLRGGFLGGAAFFLGAAGGLLGGRAHHQRLAFALLALALRLDAAVFLEHALAYGDLGLGQRASAGGRTGRGGGCRAGLAGLRGWRAGRRRGRGRCSGRGGCGRGRRGARHGRRDTRLGRRRGGALLHHLDLDGLAPAMAEGLPHAAGIHGLAEFKTPAGPKAQPALARVLLVLVAHQPIRTRSKNSTPQGRTCCASLTNPAVRPG